MQENQVKISIIVPVYNALEWLDACVSSVLNQTFQDFEVVLCDDGSKDNTYAVAQSYVERYPGKVIVIMTPLHRVSEENRDRKGHILVDYVDVIKETARYYSLPVLDLFAVSGIQPRVRAIRERFCPDGLHPNDDGHAILADRIAGFLRAL